MNSDNSFKDDEDIKMAVGTVIETLNDLQNSLLDLFDLLGILSTDLPNNDNNGAGGNGYVN